MFGSVKVSGSVVVLGDTVSWPFTRVSSHTFDTVVINLVFEGPSPLQLLSPEFSFYVLPLFFPVLSGALTRTVVTDKELNRSYVYRVYSGTLFIDT